MPFHRTLQGLGQAMRKLAQEIPLVGAKYARAAALGAIDVLVEQTPVDTGEAVSNWQVGIGAAPVTTVPPHVPGRGGATAGVNRAITRKIAEGEIKRYIGIGGPIYITNNADHIGRLNEGSSPQHPGGFVDEAMLVAQLESRKVKVTI